MNRLRLSWRTHVRFLVALPLLIVAELVVHQRMRFVVRQFLERSLIPESALTRFNAAIASAFRLRNSVLAEVEKLRNIQQSGEIGLRVRKISDREAATLIVFSKKLNPAIVADRAEVRKLLGLNPEAEEFSVVYGSVAANDKEIALLTRSVIEILTDLSSYIDVPATNVEQKRTFPSPAPELVNGAPVPPLIRLLSSPQKPDDAFAAVPYRQEWYWIDDKDFASKRLFSFIMFLFTLTDTGDKQGAPVITIPAG